MNKKICIVYTHHKLGDLIWQLPYIKAISEYHQTKISLVVRKKTQAKNILKDLEHIKYIFYNDFRKGIYYFIDTLKLYKIFKKENFDFVYILDKVNKPAIAAKLAGIQNVIGPGLRNQKKWLTNKHYLEEDDWKKNYSEQSQKFLMLNSIPLKNFFPEINIDTKEFEKDNQDLLIEGKKISFGVDSFEDFKMWQEENFIRLADMLIKEKKLNYIYLLCGPDKSHIAENIIKLSGKDYFINCSSKDLSGVILAINNSEFLVGNNSGPLNLAAALGVKSFGLIANDPISELKYSKIIPITPDDYQDNIWIRDREAMKRLDVQKVFETIIKNI
ncbi:glycosyltransferase family 9 protein [Candidatus Pelagibacter sp. HIMB1321]|uniref:glycosyltransferase family 9 protein n=1 Tax=Candidatus Pelagibacter sp. HIMB1321 TaxID=1388755 RepID=UPI000A08153D|nr:glycosyltransferase family 9 protein [Candidatus Pelagibacter sp. HIMB1321]SMF77150.1 ADP-heptose:LPS heptosyltransferase [Candidatus Pelagibacter sp. HIMB1321]